MDISYIWFAVGCIVGLIIGIFIRIRKKSYDGIFRVDLTNPEKDIFTLELICPIGEIPTKKSLIFKVTNASSQEKPLA